MAQGQPVQPIQELPTPLGTRGSAGIVGNLHVQHAPRGIAMPAQTMGAQIRDSRPRGASTR
eukprot:5365673-Alexandrium_andersonii.AAC.1